MKPVALIIFTLFFNFLFAQDGELDYTFGEYGMLFDNLPADMETCRDMKVQSDGKVVMGGSSYHHDELVTTIARYNEDGSRDESFGNNGLLFFDNSDDITTEVNALVIQQDGKIIAGGYSEKNIVNSGALFRCNNNGTIDSSFGINGISKVFTADKYNEGYIADVILQNDNKILFCGTFEDSLTRYFIVGRCLPDGTPDVSFGDGGIKMISFASSATYAEAMILQHDNKILIGGKSNTYFAVARFNADGTVDNTFGIEGKVLTDFGDHATLTDIGIFSDGKIITCGYLDLENPGPCEYGRTKIALMSLNEDGSPNNSFNSDGEVTFSIDHCNDQAFGLLVQPDNKILVAGNTGDHSFLAPYDFLILRYLSTGTLDTTFNDGGKMIEQLNEFYNYCNAIEFQSDGKVLISAYTDEHDEGEYYFSGIRIDAGLDSLDLINPIVIEDISSIYYYETTLFVPNTDVNDHLLELFDLAGKKIFHELISPGLFQKDLSLLARGLYIVSYHSQIGIINKKIIIHGPEFK